MDEKHRHDKQSGPVHQHGGNVFYHPVQPGANNMYSAPMVQGYSSYVVASQPFTQQQQQQHQPGPLPRFVHQPTYENIVASQQMAPAQQMAPVQAPTVPLVQPQQQQQQPPVSPYYLQSQQQLGTGPLMSHVYYQGPAQVQGAPKGAPGSYVTLDRVPAQINCFKCFAPIVTRVENKAGVKTVMAAAAIACVFWPLAFLPFLSNRMKKPVHVCPNCRRNLGRVVTVTSTPQNR